MFFIAQSFLSTTINPLERLYCIHFSLYFVRIWRHWILKKNNYSVINNFLSFNSYVCFEINAHGLLNLIFRCLEDKSFKYFLPWLFSSQACEGFFRNIRSLSTTFSTIVNCTVLESSQKVKRLEYLSQIQAHNFESVDNEKFFFHVQDI